MSFDLFSIYLINFLTLSFSDSSSDSSFDSSSNSYSFVLKKLRLYRKVPFLKRTIFFLGFSNFFSDSKTLFCSFAFWGILGLQLLFSFSISISNCVWCLIVSCFIQSNFIIIIMKWKQKTIKVTFSSSSFCKNEFCILKCLIYFFFNSGSNLFASSFFC